jgi:hypothetical protein
MKDADFKNLLQGICEAGSYLRGKKQIAVRRNEAGKALAKSKPSSVKGPN